MKTEAGKKISKGDLLLEFDMKKIEDAGLPLVTTGHCVKYRRLYGCTGHIQTRK